ncbi:MAG: ABC transporter permease, partial [Acidimicrobiia bacterium]
LLRTVGMSRRQVGAMVRRESLLVAVIGAVTGIVTGVIVAWAVVSTLADDGIDRFALRPLLLFGLLVAAGVVGVAAGALPAHRAARADILDAIAEE